jgi:hypothetical protein
LTEDRVAALDAIGFDWKLEAGASSSVASKDDKQNYTTESSVQPPSTEADVSSRGTTRSVLVLPEIGADHDYLLQNLVHVCVCVCLFVW